MSSGVLYIKTLRPLRHCSKNKGSNQVVRTSHIVIFSYTHETDAYITTKRSEESSG